MELLDKIQRVGHHQHSGTKTVDLLQQFHKRVITIEQGVIVSDAVGEVVEV